MEITYRSSSLGQSDPNITISESGVDRRLRSIAVSSLSKVHPEEMMLFSPEEKTLIFSTLHIRIWISNPPHAIVTRIWIVCGHRNRIIHAKNI
ncbi:uncharacterized protein G2W53_010749 [Senna tora]|uniref:Uncharacterized protein n=1 Tax=Senna tora TaxID=362788 RepID=A0A835CC10_9FABA|nr:uncharacterized protein G2W53_010749 [Senna tora]